MGENSLRPSGSPPYWATGTQILWRSGGGPLATGPANASTPRFAEPMTVVRDDADALVAWLAAGTPVLRARRADGLGKRDDKRTLFTAAVVQEIGAWTRYDVLRIAPTGRPWTVWVLFDERTGEFGGWYVNLEAAHVRDEDSVYTRDHVLDVEVEPDGTCSRKDEDELLLAVAHGVYDDAAAAAIRADAREVEAIVTAWGSPFRDGWEQFRPDPAWPVPALPREA
jgi:predicted RNA-binding protein associated with RNAse of E/G family